MSLQNDINLVRKIAWNYTKSTGMEFDDLFSESCIAYLEAENEWNESKGRKSTFLQTSMQNHLNNLLKRNQVSNKWIQYMDSEDITHIPAINLQHQLFSYQPEKHLLEKEDWENFVSHLSPEAREICNILLNDKHLYLPINTPKKCRGIIRDAMRKTGWSYPSIWNGFKELKSALN